MIVKYLRSLAFTLFFLPAAALAALPAVEATVRYMALGDSLAAGYKAQPAIAGYAYQLYLDRVFGSIPDTVFDNASVPGATSDDVLNFQVPQVHLFAPSVVTISVGGNDLLTLLGDTPPTPERVGVVLATFGGNLTTILVKLCTLTPEVRQIYLHNLYTIPEIPGTDQVVPLFNAVMADVVRGVSVPPSPCAGRTVRLADVFSAFLGQQGLLLIERFEKKGFQNTFEVHPTDKGHRVIEDAFRAVIVP